MNLDLDIWKSQNAYFSLLKGFHMGRQHFVNEAWKNTFFRLGGLLNIRHEAVFAKEPSKIIKV